MAAAAADDLDSGLFNIALSDSEGEDGNAATETTRDRTGQTEEEFQTVKRAYRPKVDNGEVSSGFRAIHPHKRHWTPHSLQDQQ